MLPQEILGLTIESLIPQEGNGSALVDIAKRNVVNPEALPRAEETTEEFIDKTRKEIQKLRNESSSDPEELANTTVEQVLVSWNKNHLEYLENPNFTRKCFYLWPMGALFEALIAKGCPRESLGGIPGAEEIFLTLDETNRRIGPYCCD